MDADTQREWNQIQAKIVAFTEKRKEVVFCYSRLGYIGTCYADRKVKDKVAEVVRKGNQKIFGKSLEMRPERMSFNELRTSVVTLAGSKRTHKYKEGKCPEYWRETGVPFRSPFKSVNGKTLSKRDLVKIVKSARAYYERVEDQDDEGERGGDRGDGEDGEDEEVEVDGDRGDGEDGEDEEVEVDGDGGDGEDGEDEEVGGGDGGDEGAVGGGEEEITEGGIGGSEDTPPDAIDETEEDEMMQAFADESDLGLNDPERFEDIHYDNMRKIGEGTFGEVFSGSRQGHNVVIKVVPFDGHVEVNGEGQKRLPDIKSEIIIANELTTLRPRSTTSFCELKSYKVVCGSYPPDFLHQWDVFNDRKGSENDRPDSFPDDQKYVIFEFNNCGQDLESYQVGSVAQAKSIVLQVAHALSVAERAFEFEHRDLHWGNVLVTQTEEESIHFNLEGEDHVVASHGARVSIIDFTLSRLTKDGVTVFVNLGLDEELFSGEGDIQFHVYRDMREKLRNNWRLFEPATNVLWIQYLTEKLTVAKQYGRGKVSLRELQFLKRKASFSKSATDFISKL